MAYLPDENKKSTKKDILMPILYVLLGLVGAFNICIISYIGWKMVPFLLNGGVNAAQAGVQPTATQPQTTQTPSTATQTEQPATSDDPVSDSPSSDPRAEIVSENLHIFTDYIGTETALYLCEIKNTGSVPIKIENISVDVKDASGKILTSTDYISSHPDVIPPGKSTYICEEVIGSLDTGANASDASAPVLHYSVAEKDVKTISAEITQASLGIKSTYPNLTGKIKNTGTENLTSVYISVPVFSSGGELQTVIFTIVEDLPAGEEKGFEQMAINCDTGMDFSSSVLGEISAYTPTIF